MTTVIYAGLFLTTCAYAALLARFRHLWEPHLTWLEVVIGTALCLLAPYLAARQNRVLTWTDYETLTWAAFVVGGAPILIWQLIQSVRAWLRVEHRIRNRNDNTGHPTDRATSLAEERRRGPQTDD